MAKRGEDKKRAGWYDIETKNWTQFELGAIYFPDADDTVFFRSQQMMYEYVRDNPLCLYAHNGGGFDVKFFLPASCEDGSFRWAVRAGGRWLTVAIGQSILHDTLYLMKEGLGKLGPALVGQSKGEIAYDTIDKDDPKTRAYLESDCRLLHACHIEFLKRLDLPITCHTIGSAAVRKWLEIEGLDAPPYETGLEKWHRLGYYGGRTELLTLQAPNATTYDINSQYPAIMHLHEFPLGPFRWKSGGKLTHKTVMAEVELEIPHKYVPPAPIMGSRLYFPTGKFTTTLPAPELAYCDRFIQRVNWQTQSEHWGRPFTKFVGHFWEMRKQAQRAGDDGTQKICKWLLNSLSGKLGEDRSKEIFRHVSEDSPRYPNDHYVDDECTIRVDTRISHLNYVQPALCAIITSAGRVMLHRAMDRNTVACATDSIVTTGAGPKGQGVGLGQWKKEGTGPVDMLQCGLGNLAGKIKTRGYNTLEKGVTPGQIYQELRDNGATTLERFGGAMRVLCTREFKLERTEKVLQPYSYRKRAVELDGVHTRPWSFDELLEFDSPALGY